MFFFVSRFTKKRLTFWIINTLLNKFSLCKIILNLLILRKKYYGKSIFRQISNDGVTASLLASTCNIPKKFSISLIYRRVSICLEGRTDNPAKRVSTLVQLLKGRSPMICNVNIFYENLRFLTLIKLFLDIFLKLNSF